MAFEGCLNDLNGLILLTLSYLSLPFGFGCLRSLSCTHSTTIPVFCRLGKIPSYESLAHEVTLKSCLQKDYRVVSFLVKPTLSLLFGKQKVTSTNGRPTHTQAQLVQCAVYTVHPCDYYIASENCKKILNC